MPYPWLQSAPKGELVLDPTVSVEATQDVWLQGTLNLDGASSGLIIGHALGINKRSLVKFDLSTAGIPANATVVKAQLRLKYHSRISSNGVWIDRPVQVHQVLVPWEETEATRDVRLNGVAWNAPYGAIDGTDVKAIPESTVLFSFSTVVGSWQSWDLTALTKAWLDGTESNYGVLVWANNEDTEGYELQFRSSDDGYIDQPVLEVVYTRPTKTVYFLKDHPSGAGQVLAA